MELTELCNALQNDERKIVQLYFRPEFTGTLSENISTQLENILQEQFREHSYGEIGGCVVPKNGTVDLQIVETREKKNIEEDLRQYEAGIYSEESQARLTRYAEFVKSGTEKAFGEDRLEVKILSCIYDVFSLAPESDLFKKFNPEFRKQMSDWYKQSILGNIYSFSVDEFDPNFVGIFHVHDNGSEPSPNDINKNKLMPLVDLVISAKADYVQSGVKLYLVHSGSFELLYQGLLQPKPENY